MRICRVFARFLSGLWRPLVVLAAAALFFLALLRVGSGHDEAGRQLLEDSLRRAAVACYAAEGIYPPTISYLEEHYGVQIDRTRYAVFYEIFAENLMPEITVVELE